MEFSEAVKLAASIDLKKEEPGLCTYCEKYDIPFQTFSKRRAGTGRRTLQDLNL